MRTTSENSFRDSTDNLSIQDEILALRESIADLRIDGEEARKEAQKQSKFFLGRAEKLDRVVAGLEDRLSTIEAKFEKSNSIIGDISYQPSTSGNIIKGRFIAGSRVPTGHTDNSEDKLQIYYGDRVGIRKYNTGKYAYKTEGTVVRGNHLGRQPPKGFLFIKIDGIDELTHRSVHTLTLIKDE